MRVFTRILVVAVFAGLLSACGDDDNNNNNVDPNSFYGTSSGYGTGYTGYTGYGGTGYNGYQNVGYGYVFQPGIGWVLVQNGGNQNPFGYPCAPGNPFCYR